MEYIVNMTTILKDGTGDEAFGKVLGALNQC